MRLTWNLNFRGEQVDAIGSSLVAAAPEKAPAERVRRMKVKAMYIDDETEGKR